MGETPKKPWWRKKRWRIAAALWLTLPPLYLLSRGPVAYCSGRGWIKPESRVHRLYAPLYRCGWAFHPSARPWHRYVDWAYFTGKRHAGSWPPPPSRPTYNGLWVRGELPRVMPDRHAPAAPASPSDVPPLPLP